MQRYKYDQSDLVLLLVFWDCFCFLSVFLFKCLMSTNQRIGPTALVRVNVMFFAVYQKLKADGVVGLVPTFKGDVCEIAGHSYMCDMIFFTWCKLPMGYASPCVVDVLASGHDAER